MKKILSLLMLACQVIPSGVAGAQSSFRLTRVVASPFRLRIDQACNEPDVFSHPLTEGAKADLPRIIAQLREEFLAEEPETLKLKFLQLESIPFLKGNMDFAEALGRLVFDVIFEKPALLADTSLWTHLISSSVIMPPIIFSAAQKYFRLEHPDPAVKEAFLKAVPNFLHPALLQPKPPALSETSVEPQSHFEDLPRIDAALLQPGDARDEILQRLAADDKAGVQSLLDQMHQMGSWVWPSENTVVKAINSLSFDGDLWVIYDPWEGSTGIFILRRPERGSPYFTDRQNSQEVLHSQREVRGYRLTSPQRLTQLAALKTEAPKREKLIAALFAKGETRGLQRMAVLMFGARADATFSWGKISAVDQLTIGDYLISIEQLSKCPTVYKVLDTDGEEVTLQSLSRRRKFFITSSALQLNYRKIVSRAELHAYQATRPKRSLKPLTHAAAVKQLLSLPPPKAKKMSASDQELLCLDHDGPLHAYLQAIAYGDLERMDAARRKFTRFYKGDLSTVPQSQLKAGDIIVGKMRKGHRAQESASDLALMSLERKAGSEEGYSATLFGAELSVDPIPAKDFRIVKRVLSAKAFDVLAQLKKFPLTKQLLLRDWNPKAKNAYPRLMQHIENVILGRPPGWLEALNPRRYSASEIAVGDVLLAEDFNGAYPLLVVVESIGARHVSVSMIRANEEHPGALNLPITSFGYDPLVRLASRDDFDLIKPHFYVGAFFFAGLGAAHGWRPFLVAYISNFVQSHWGPFAIGATLALTLSVFFRFSKKAGWPFHSALRAARFA